MEEVRKGLQTPTQSVILPYSKSRGDEAKQLYNKSRNKLLEWQEMLLEPILAIRDDGLFVHQKFGIAIPRRNGKSELMIAILRWALQEGLKVMYTAHRTQTSRAIWERLQDMLLEVGFKNEDLIVSKQIGMERIDLKKTKGRVAFRTRTAKGGLGEGYDVLIIDEAQEYTTDQEAAIKYVVSDAPNPLTVMIGTPPTTQSSGTVFSKYREDINKGLLPDCGWAEWSVETMADPYNREYWYQTNPSLGTILTERKILAEISGDDLDFNIQRLGYWIRYNIKSAISKAEWDELLFKPKKSQLEKQISVGIKYGKDGTNVALSIAIKTTDERVFVEAIGCKSIRDGNDWIINFIKKVSPDIVVIDGVIGRAILQEILEKLKLTKPILPTTQEVIIAHAKFENAIHEKTLCHNEQPSLTAIVSNCEKRAIGSNGGFGYRSIKDGLDIALMESVIFAHWGVFEIKVKKKQKISY